MAAARNLVYVLLCFLARIHLSFSGKASGQADLESVPDLEKSMYTVIDGYPCVRLLNLSGEIGCSTGVLVESGNQTRNGIRGLSPDKKFPQAEFSPYRSNNFDWNPAGSGIMWKSYNFPVLLLSESSTSTLKEVAAKNEKSRKAYTLDVTEFDLVMQTTKVGTHDSETCLREETCLPLGGYSVWSALPPITVSPSGMVKPVILAMASMDSASFFRDKSLGADSPLSGLISLLAAVDALSRVEGLNDLAKQLVFVIFTGEAWGYLGSRRFLLELDQQTESVSGLNSSLIEKVVEIGSVGKGKTFFAHTTGVSPATNETLKALQRAQDSIETKSVNISTASTSNPGLPPSSLMAFLRKNSQTSGMVLEDYDTAFTNQFYHSHLDDLSNINSSVIVEAASLVARTLYILASDDKDLSASSISRVNVNTSLVEELLGCLLNCEPGLSCELVKRYISPTSSCPSHYVGVIVGEPSSNPYSGYVGDVPRFLWNFLADKTSISPGNGMSACPKNCNGTGEMCIREETDGKGVCVISTTRYVPAYSTRLKFESETWTVLPPNSSDPMGLADPVWAESNWNTISLRVYTVQDASYDYLVLVTGISVTVLAYIAIETTRAFITKSMKRD